MEVNVTNRKFNLLKVGWLILLCFGMIFIGANPSQALPLELTNTYIYYEGPAATVSIDGNPVTWLTHYFLYADQFKSIDDDGVLTAFCVEEVQLQQGIGYALVAVPPSLYNAAVIASQYFSGGQNWSQTATQIAIWEAAFDSGLNIDGGRFQYSGTYQDQVEGILAMVNQSSITGSIALAQSPPETGDGASQDYLVAYSVPDAAVMFLLGPALLGLGLLGRRRRSEN